MSTFPSLNIEKLRNDTIKKLEKEKQDKINREKQQQKQYDYQNYLNLSHIKNSKSHKYIKDEYYNHTKNILGLCSYFGGKDAYRNIIQYSTFNKRTGLIQWRPRNNQLGPNDIIIAAIDERGATTAHEFKIHAFENPSARQFVNTGWPLMLTFVGMMFAWGVAQI